MARPKSSERSRPRSSHESEDDRPAPYNRRIRKKENPEKVNVLQEPQKPPRAQPKAGEKPRPAAEAEKPVEPEKPQKAAPRPKIKAMPRPPRSRSPPKPPMDEGKKPRARSTSRTDASIVEEIKEAIREAGGPPRARSALPRTKEPRIVLEAVREIERSVAQGHEKRAPPRKRAKSVHSRVAIPAA